MMLSKLFILFIGEILCFPNALSQKFSLKEVHEASRNELQNDIPVFHFPERQPISNSISKPQRLQTIKHQKSNSQQPIHNRKVFHAAGYDSYEPIDTVLATNKFFNMYRQMFEQEW